MTQTEQQKLAAKVEIREGGIYVRTSVRTPLYPGRWDFPIHQGHALNIPLIWENEEKAVVDLTGWTAVLTIKEHPDLEEAIAELSEVDGITLSDEEPNITVTVEQATIDTYDFTQAVYSLVLTDGDGVSTVLLKGFVQLRRR